MLLMSFNAITHWSQSRWLVQRAYMLMPATPADGDPAPGSLLGVWAEAVKRAAPQQSENRVELLWSMRNAGSAGVRKTSALKQVVAEYVHSHENWLDSARLMGSKHGIHCLMAAVTAEPREE